ncbi:hypothetical protein [Streptomyces manipurensis]|uniref:hypothetical protein n=1 Tax=Streptomyces manipurensis TaxID=1077945 RepID=UPI003C6F19AD
MSVRTAAAIAVVAGVVTTLLPLSATAASAAPAGGDHAVLRTEMGTPVPNGPLTRGGATESFDLTVKNPTGKAVEYKPWMLLHPKGPSLLQEKDVVFRVEAVDAPATTSSVGRQDGEWQGTFAPSAGSGSSASGFDIPANGKMTWKVTIGLGTDYPTNNGDFTLTATSYNNSVAAGGSDSHLFTVDPKTKTGELKTWFKQVGSGKDGQEQRAYLDLNYQATGDGTFATALATSLSLSHPGEQAADFRLQGLIDGRWQDLRAEDGRYELPRIPKGFGAASGVHTLPLRVSLGLDTKIPGRTLVTMTAEVRHDGGSRPLRTATLTFPLAPIVEPVTTPPVTTPTTPVTPTTPTTPPATTAPVQQAVATGTGTTPGTTTTTTTTGSGVTTTGSSAGSLATTGAGSATGLYAALAGALVALGAAAVWIGRRRRVGA